MVIGLTGGIGTGKSTVSQILKDRGFTVIDLDVISHEVVKFPSVVEKIIKNFGREVLVDNEAENYIVSRKKLGKIIFADKEKRFALNSIMHPEILRVMRKKILECKLKKEKDEKGKNKIIFVEIQLLFEVGWENEFDLILLVWADKNTQIKRVLARDKRSENETENIINSQISLDEKIKKSDYVIENNNDNLEDLKNKIDDFINFLETKLNFEKKRGVKWKK